MSSYLPSAPTITVPPWLQHFYAYFPIVTYPAVPPTAPPSIPTLWLLGPPPAESGYSLDPACRVAQALAQFSGVKVAVKWLDTSAGGVGARLPNLHLPDGSLLSHEELPEWFLQPDSRAHSSAKANKPTTPAPTPETTDPTYQAFSSLLRSTLLPATLAAVYLASTPAQVTPAKALPVLSALAARVTAQLARRARAAEVQKLRGGKAGFLDLEELDREAAEALEAFETKLGERSKEGGIEGWFDGAG